MMMWCNYVVITLRALFWCYLLTYDLVVVLVYRYMCCGGCGAVWWWWDGWLTCKLRVDGRECHGASHQI